MNVHRTRLTIQTFILLFIISCSLLSHAQDSIPSLKKFVEKGICGVQNEACKEYQIKYIKTCEFLGDYYYKQKNYKAALHYYMLVASLGVYAGNELQYDEPIRLRNNVAEKAGDMYLSATGVKEDRARALALHNKTPLLRKKTKQDAYSQRYFGSTSKYYIPDSILVSSDSVKYFAVNPFYLEDSTTTCELKKEFTDIKAKLQKDKKLKCVIELSYGFFARNELNQTYFNRQLQSLTSCSGFTIKDNYSIVLKEEAAPAYYKGVNLPRLSLRLIR